MFAALSSAASKAASAVSTAASNMATAGIAVKNESSVPVLVIVSQLTPLYWTQEKLMPGDTWNAGNHLGMGKVWFTVSVSMFDKRNVPTVVGTAVNLLAITATFVAPVALPIFIGTAIVSGITAARGVSKTGVYSDGSTLFVRGSAEDSAYVLHFASDEERASNPYAGPPPPEAIAAVTSALQGIALPNAPAPAAEEGAAAPAPAAGEGAAPAPQAAEEGAK